MKSLERLHHWGKHLATTLAYHLKRLFSAPKIADLPIEFFIDVDDQGNHTARVSYTINGKTTPISDIASLGNYGQFSIVQKGKKYVASIDDIETIQALFSFSSKPQSTQDKLVFETSPLILQHLRKKRNISESQASREYEIKNTPLEVGAKVDFHPELGAMIQAGYRLPDTEELIPAHELKITPDGNYAQIGKQFYPLPPTSDKAKAFLRDVYQRIPLDHIPEFFKRDLVLLKTEFQAVLTDQASKLKVIDSPLKPRVRVEIREPGWLDFQIDYQSSDFSIPFEEISNSKEEFLRADPYTFIRKPPLEEIQTIQKALKDIPYQETTEGYRIPIAQFRSLEEFIEHIGGLREVDLAYQKFLDELEGFEPNESFTLSEAIEQTLKESGIILRPYQRSGIHWLTWLIEHHLHGLLADDMGLGKTIQTIVALRWAIEKEGKSNLLNLIVCPKSVVRHWQREIQRCYPSCRVYEYTGSTRNRYFWQQRRSGIVISNYEVVTKDVDLIAKVPLFFLVLDEATKIKNPETKRTQAIKSLNAAHRIVLTGTPIENRPLELWSIFDFLMKGHLGRYSTFQRLFEIPISQGDASATERLAKRIGPFMKRRKKEDVATDLPQKIEMEERVELTGEQRSLYLKIQEEAKPLRISLLRNQQVSKPAILAAITKLKQVCDHPALITKQMHPIEKRSEKFDRTLELIQEIVEQGEQVVLFSHFLDSLKLFEIALGRQGIQYVRLDGATSLNLRQDFIDHFNSRQVPVALCSLQAMGHGVNLTAANHVIHFDRWWNPAVEDQATDRVHRIGQNKTVIIHLIVVANTLEEKIANLLTKKRDLSGKIINLAATYGESWSREELLELLSPLE